MVQIDSGTTDTVGPKKIASVSEAKETAMSKRGVGIVAVSGSGVKNYGERRSSDARKIAKESL